ncbi:MAG: AsmA family protein, partial [Hyphomicrobiales bacterium]|nr:AsmA family protein [Hyphomicrobiales bacterium]
YNLTQVVASDGQRSGDAPGWRSEGSFTLTRDRLLVDKAVLSEGPPDRPSSMAGSAIIELGVDARFEATLQARQLDLDRSLGAGPSEPVEVGAAATRFVEWLAGIPVPPIPGQIRFDVPAIVVGGNIIRDVRFRARPEDYGWRIEGLQATLPGQAAFQADGQLSTGEQVGFGGQVRLAVGQPATFAAWWRGQNQDGAGRLLAPFELTGRATVTPDSVSVKDMSTRIDNATIAGAFSWSRTGETGQKRSLRTDLQADRLDFTQIRALAELLGGHDFSDATVIADSYAIKLAAGELATEDVRMRDVEIDAAFDDGDLTVNGIRIGDVGGASFEVTRGQIDDVLSQPRGRLEAQLTAGELAGLARIVDRLAPDTPVSRWFNRTASSLSAATATVKIDSVLDNGVPNSQLEVRGSAGASQFDVTIELAGAPATWRTGSARVVGSLKSYDAVGVARQAGIDAANVDIGGASIDLEATGVPQEGMATKLDFSFGDLSLESNGTLILAAELPPKYTGTYDLKTEDVDPLIGMVGLAIPGAALGTPLALAGDINVLGPTAEMSWTNGVVAGQRMTGDLRIAEADDGGVRIDGGKIELDTVDLGWITSLGLGFAPRPGDDPDQPWSRTPFGEPVYGRLSAELDVAAERLTVSDSIHITNAELQMTLVPNRIELSVKSGEVIGGKVTGGLSIRNVGGNANVNGQMSMLGASLDPVIWHRAGRAVATGTLDVSVDFEATGRSPAGLISSLTGGGTLALSAGEARYVNPRAANLVIRASDRGQQFDEDQLRDLFASYIDAGALAFTQAEAAFSIAAGTVRIQNMTVDTDAAGTSGSAAIDLNRMRIDSDWTLTLESGDIDDPGPPPQVGIVFRGPIAAPDRILDVLQFNSYLNIRQEARIQQILIMEEEARLERERLNRLKRKLKEDALRREQLEEAARVARRTAALNIEDFQVTRGIHIEAALEAGRAAWWDRMTIAREDKLAALERAREALAVAEAEAERAVAAMEAVANAERSAKEVADLEKAAADALAEANRVLAKMEQQAVEAQETVIAAETRIEVAAGAVADAEDALADATAEHEAARAVAEAAAEARKSATGSVGNARALAQSARATAVAAEAEAEDKAALAVTAEEALNAAEAEAATASANVTALTEVETVATKTHVEAKTAVAAGAERFAIVEAEAKTAEAELAAARGLATEAEAGVTAAIEQAESSKREAALVGQLLLADQQDWDEISQTVELARAELARLEASADEGTPDGETETADGEFDPAVGESEELKAARQALADAETAQQEADIRLGEAEIANTEAKALVDQKTLEVEAARVALEQANA